MSNSSPSHSPPSSVCSLGQLPWYDIIFPHIFVKLTYRDLFKLRRVSRSFYSLVDAYFAYTTTIDLSTTLSVPPPPPSDTTSSTMTDKKDNLSITTRAAHNESTSGQQQQQQQLQCHKVKVEESELVQQLALREEEATKDTDKCRNEENTESRRSLMPPEVADNEHSRNTWYTQMDTVDENVSPLTSHSLCNGLSKFNSTSLAVILWQKELHSIYRCTHFYNCNSCSPRTIHTRAAAVVSPRASCDDGRDFTDTDSESISCNTTTSDGIFYISSNSTAHESVTCATSTLTHNSNASNVQVFKCNFTSERTNIKCHKSTSINTCHCLLCVDLIECMKSASHETKDDHLNSNSSEISICYDEEEEEEEEEKSETGQCRIKGETLFYDLPVNENQVNRDVHFFSTLHDNQFKLPCANNSYTSVKGKVAINDASCNNFMTGIDSHDHQVDAKISSKMPHNKQTSPRIASNLYNQSFKIVTGIKYLNLSSCNWLTDDDLLRVINCCSLQPALEVLDLSACYRVSK